MAVFNGIDIHGLLVHHMENDTWIQLASSCARKETVEAKRSWSFKHETGRLRRLQIYWHLCFSC